jgi:hypothetical protein
MSAAGTGRGLADDTGPRRESTVLARRPRIRTLAHERQRLSTDVGGLHEGHRYARYYSGLLQLPQPKGMLTQNG